jgi:hypothetical protein
LLDTLEQIRCVRRAETRAFEDGGFVLGQQMPARMAVEQGLERDCPLIQLIEEIARARRHAGERDWSWLRKPKDPRRDVSGGVALLRCSPWKSRSALRPPALPGGSSPPLALKLFMLAHASIRVPSTVKCSSDSSALGAIR